MTPASLTYDVDRLVSGSHHDPHSFLGAHPGADGRTIIRTFHPEARSARVILGDGSGHPMTKVDTRGLFEVEVDTPTGRYLLALTSHTGSWEIEDAYSFVPTLGDLDIHLIGQGTHEQLWTRLGARTLTHDGVAGVAFAVWAPAAHGVTLICEGSHWDDRIHPMRSLGSSGVWELFMPRALAGMRYKFVVHGADGHRRVKADPMARQCEIAPATASIVDDTHYAWHDDAWVKSRDEGPHLGSQPLSIYELHIGSWRRGEGNSVLGYRDIAEPLANYCNQMGFTHVEFMPLAEHPFTGSWGYQVTGYYAPTSRYGSPDDLRYLVDHLHKHKIGVIVDWVPAHFPKDDWSLGRFDGTSLYEHDDPRRGEQPDWGTYIFNFGRTEVRNFLLANALYWISEFHIDGLRVDAVASMLYLDYSRKEGEWIPNEFGGRENLEAMSLLREVNEAVGRQFPHVVTIAEESTAWGGVSRPTAVGGLGFHFKWNMGWMHDTLDYISKNPIYRQYHHNELTFGFVYAWSESFVLPISHDEVVHGKGSLLGRMPGDEWQRFANLRAFLAWMWSHPGKKLLFMGQEFGQSQEWKHDQSIDWHLLQYPVHEGAQRLVTDLNHLYRTTPALYERDDDPGGFMWIDGGNALDNILSCGRIGKDGRCAVVCITNFSPSLHAHFRVGLPYLGHWSELLNTDSTRYAGSGQVNPQGVDAVALPWNDQPASAEITIPPLGAVWLGAPPQ